MLYDALGFPVGLLPVLQMSGWLALCQAMLQDPEQKTARPKPHYPEYELRPVPAG